MKYGRGSTTARPPAVLLILATAVSAAAIVPLAQMLVRALGSGPDIAIASVVRPRTLSLLGNTLALCGVVGLGCMVLGVLTAWIIVHYRLPGRRLWWILACLPLAVPSYVAAFAWLSTFPTIVGFWPLCLIMILSSTPLVTIPTLGAVVIADRSLFDVSRTLGRGPVRGFVEVILPQILPAALAGTLLVILYTLSDFGAPAMLRFETLTTGVYGLFSSGINRAGAASLALVLGAIALACVAGERALRHRTVTQRRTAHSTADYAQKLRPLSAVALQFLLSLVAMASLGFPIAALVVRMASSLRYGSDWTRLVEATLSTLSLGIAAATITVLAALPISYLTARYRGRVINLLESSAFLGDGLPGVVVALAMVSLSLTLGPAAYQSAGLLIACYLILFVSKSIGAARSAFALVSVRTEEVSRTLGRGPLSTWFSVTARGAAPGIGAGWLLVLVAVFKELPATLMLRPIEVTTLATELWSKTTLGAYGAAAPIGILLILIGVIPAWWLSKSMNNL